MALPWLLLFGASVPADPSVTGVIGTSDLSVSLVGTTSEETILGTTDATDTLVGTK